ncbi:MAG: four-helix bundle copper-binding protein [Bacteroidia bacterium]|nr:four-helix bundle copper-binding protein [Bacteroidia bacterium]
MSERYRDCIAACLECVKACHYCVAGDLKEDHDMAGCVRLNIECAAICSATAKLMTMESEQAVALAKVCAELCKKCEQECSKHNTQHCRDCAKACHSCALLCNTL